MVVSWYLVVLRVFLVVVNFDLIAGDDELASLVFVNVVFRHGDRTPVDPYPNDPYKNTSYWPIGYGQLTDLGKEQHYELGKWLRQRYQGFLPEVYNKSDIHVQSTDVDRTLMSAQSNLAGLYEPSNMSTNWNSNIRWSPIPVHTVPELLDSILAAKKPCPRYKKEIQNFQNSDFIRKLNIKYKDIYKYLTEMTGGNIKSILDVEYLNNTFLIEQLNNLTLPDWTKQVYPEPMNTVAGISFMLPCYTEKLARLKTGPLLADMIKHFKQKLNNSITEKMWMYSAHDTTIANLLNMLKVFQPHSPPYASTILLELRKKKSDYFVNVFYKNSTDVFFLAIPNCDKNCPLGKFLSLTEAVVPIDWEQECKIPESYSTEYELVAFFSFSSLLIVLLLIVLLFYKKYVDTPKHVYHSVSVEQIN